MHAIRIWASADVPTRQLNRFLDNLPERRFRSRDIPISQAWTGENETGEEMLVGLFRVDPGVITKEGLLDTLETELTILGITWYRIAYHDCDLRLPPEERTGCPPWAVERVSGPVPTSEMW